MSDLITAACLNDTSKAKALIRAGANVNQTQPDGYFALFWAAYQGNLELMRLLLDKGADPEMEDLNHYTALEAAVMRNQADAAIQLLLAHTTKHGDRALLMALEHGYTSIAHTLIAAGVHVNKPTSAPSPLLKILLKRNASIITSLVELGATYHPLDLHYAVKNAHPEAIKILLEAGIDIEGKDSEGFTPLLRAASANHTGAMQILLENGARTDQTGTDGETLSTIAIRNDNLPMMQLLIKHGVENHVWLPLDDHQVAQIGLYPALNQKLTNIFNFSSRERFTIADDLTSKAKAISSPTSFDDTEPHIVEEALDHFILKGGKADRNFVLRGISRMKGKL